MAEDGEPALQVVEDGIRLLESLGGSKAVSVVAVAGKYRTGKSFFLNRLVSSSIAFNVGETTEPCTRGIWLWLPEPAIVLADGSRLVLMDTEGLNSPDKTESFDAKIFALALLLSSYFVLNVTGVIDDATIEQLFLVTELSKRIQVNRQSTPVNDHDQNVNKLAEELPPLLVLVRDFALLPKRNGVAISDNEYLEDALRERGGPSERQAQRDATRRSLRAIFPTRSCATLVRPCADEEALRRASELDDTSLRPQFTKKLRQLRQTLLGHGASDQSLLSLPNVRKKQVMGSSVTGPMLARLAQAHVLAVNAGAAPSIRGAWDAAAEQICVQALENALLQVESECSSTTFEQFPDRWHFEHWFKEHCTDRARAAFEAEAVENHVAARKAKRKLRIQLESNREALYLKLYQKSADACRQVLHEALGPPADNSGAWMGAVANALDQKLGPILSSLKGPARNEIFIREDNASAAGLFFIPSERFAAELVARPAVNVMTNLAQEAAAAAQEKLESVLTELNLTRTRLETSLERQDELTHRGDALEAARHTATQELEEARTEIFKLRHSIADLKAENAKLSVRLDDARAATVAHAAVIADTERQLSFANANYIALQAAAEDAAILAQESADAKEASHAMDLLRLAQETTASLNDAALADKTVTLALVNQRNATDLAEREAAAFCLAQCISTVEALHKREYDLRRHANDKDRAVQAALAQATKQRDAMSPGSGVTERIAKIGQLFSRGHEKVESVTKTLLQRIDDELNDDED